MRWVFIVDCKPNLQKISEKQLYKDGGIIDVGRRNKAIEKQELARCCRYFDNFVSNAAKILYALCYLQSPK